MHKFAEIIFDQELELIPNFIEDDPPANTKPDVWYIGKSIEMMAEADYFICFDTVLVNDVFKGCEIEKQVATTYGIEMYCIRDKMLEMHILGDIASIAMKVDHSEIPYWDKEIYPIMYSGDEQEV